MILTGSCTIAYRARQREVREAEAETMAERDRKRGRETEREGERGRETSKLLAPAQPKSQEVDVLGPK